jgi:hypothetical protein
MAFLWSNIGTLFHPLLKNLAISKEDQCEE